MFDECEILQEKKPDWDCDEWEKGSLTESIIACIEKEKALDPKVDNKKIDKAVRSSCFSTRNWTMKGVHGFSTVENISLKSARAILSTVVNEYSDNRDHIFSNEASEKISEKYSLRSEWRIVLKRVS